MQVAGYIQQEKGNRTLNVTVPGFFGNNSLVHGVVAHYGPTGAQCDDHCRANKLNGSSCAPCVYGENKDHPGPMPADMNYQVDVQQVSGLGFPFKYDYSTCTGFNRHHEDCSYWPPAPDW